MDGAAVKPLIALFGPELAAQMWVGADGGWSELVVGTWTRGLLGAERVSSLLDEVFGFPRAAVDRVDELADRYRYPECRLEVVTRRDAVDPVVRLGYRRQGDGADLHRALGELGAGAVAAPLLRLARDLLTDTWVELRAVLDPQPRFEVDLQLVVADEQVPDLGARVAEVCVGLGVSAPQARWFGGVMRALAPRPVNDLVATVPIGASGLGPGLSLVYPDVPARRVLKLLTQLAPAQHTGTRLGALTAAVGVEADLVSHLTVVARDVEPPGLAFTLDAPERPRAGTA